MHGTLLLNKKRSPIAEKIKKLLVSEGITRRDLARLAGVHPGDIENIEHEIPLRLETKLKILRILYAKAT